jgi:hypothetical protein
LTYQIIDNFAAGLDTRKSPLTSPAGTLTRLINAAITPGGEIQKRRAFVAVANVAGSFGLASTESTLYVFGRSAVPSLPTWPVAGVSLKALSIPNGSTGLDQVDYDTFDGKVYLSCIDTNVALNADGTVPPGRNPHYWDPSTTTPGTGMVLTEGAGKGYHVRTYQSKVYAVLGRNLSFSAVGNPFIWNAATIVNSVNVSSLSNTNPARCTVAVGDITKFSNGKRIMVSGADELHGLANGLHTISAVNTPANTFILDDVDCSGAAAAQTTGVKIDDQPTAGRGYINLSMQDADSETLTSLEVYYDKLSVFSSEAVQIWAVDPDPAQNSFTQLLRAAGTLAPRSPLQYGSGDVLYLDQSGIRSLKAKDSSNSAAVSDIGSPVDPTIQSLLASKGQAYMDKAIALLEPSVGRFWMVFPDLVLVLSYFPGPKITAWSMYTLNFTVKHAVTCGGRIFFRSIDDIIYAFGGITGTEFDNCGVEVRLPYLDGKKPGHKKQFAAIDATVNGPSQLGPATGAWRVAVSFDFNNADQEETVGTINAPTWNMGASELQGYDSHFSLRFYNNDTGAATISNCAIHYSVADDEA